MVAHSMEVTGTASHPFRDTALVTHLLDADNKPLITLIAAISDDKQAMVRQLDYTAYPVASLKPAELFYRQTSN